MMANSHAEHRPGRVALLIDADNLSADVIEQAIEHLLQNHGAIHFRRAYCSPQKALELTDILRRHAIRPMVNVPTGKNSTDIALAVDAIDLALTERPDVVVIASSDSDYAPLAQRLREKGCRVLGIGQAGKTGSESPLAYDGFIDLAHRSSKGRLPATPSSRGGAAVPPPVASALPSPASATRARSRSRSGSGSGSGSGKRAEVREGADSGTPAEPPRPATPGPRRAPAVAPDPSPAPTQAAAGAGAGAGAGPGANAGSGANARSEAESSSDSSSGSGPGSRSGSRTGRGRSARESAGGTGAKTPRAP